MIDSVNREACSISYWIGFSAILSLVYAALFFSLDALPFLDLPSHLVRSGVIIQLLTSEKFGELFWVDVGLQPYLWGDIALGVIISIFGPILAARLWITLSFVVLPLALLVTAQRLGLSKNRKVFLFLIMLYLATDWFFLAAFANFRFGIAVSLLALSLFLSRDDQQSAEQQRIQISVFIGLALLAYLLHFAAFFFLAIITCCFCVLRLTAKSLSLRDALLLLAPLAFFGLFHITQSAGSGDYFQVWVLRTIIDKVKAVGSMLVRFDLTTDAAFACVLFFLLALPLAFGWRSLRKNSQARNLLITGFVLGIIYLALPVAVATLSDVDGRALPFILIIGTLLAAVVGPEILIRRLIPVCAMVATLNLLYIAPPLVAQNSFLRSYRLALQQIPAHKKLLPVTTRPEIGRIHTTTHAGDLYTLLGEGFTPYISNAYLGEPFTYFHYREQFYAPLIFWYERRLVVEWDKVRSFYDYLIVTHPFDPTIFPQDALERVFANQAATVYRVTPEEKGTLPFK